MPSRRLYPDFNVLKILVSQMGYVCPGKLCTVDLVCYIRVTSTLSIASLACTVALLSTHVNQSEMLRFTLQYVIVTFLQTRYPLQNTSFFQTPFTSITRNMRAKTKANYVNLVTCCCSAIYNK